MIFVIPRKKMNAQKSGSKKKVIIILAGIIFVALIVIFNLQAQREKAIKVTIEKVKTQDLASLVSASGEVKPKKNVEISAHVSGRIVKIGVVEGEQVKAGDFLLKLDSIQYEANAERDRASIRSFRADLIRAEAQLKKDENFYLRQRKLYDEELISRGEMEDANAQYDIAKASHEAIMYQIKQAEASLQSTLDMLNKTTYHSPIDGVITSLRVEEGEIAMIGTMNNPGTVLMTIADLSIMEVEVEVDETDVIGLELGQEADVRIDALPDQVIRGSLTEIGSSALQKVTTSQESKDFKAVITLIEPPQSLKPGLSASADIITAEKKAVTVIPISAMIIKEDEDDEAQENTPREGVYVVEDNRTKFQPVEKGIMGDLLIEITSGLKDGQEVVSGPYSALRILKDDALIKRDKSKDEEK